MQRIISALASDAETGSICLPLPISVALPGTGNLVQHLEGDGNVVLLVSAEGTADAVEQEALGLVDGVG